MGFFSHIGLGFVDDAIHAVGKVADKVVNVVGDAVSHVADFVGNTINAAVHDPIGTIAKIAAVATGNIELLPLISGADTYIRTGDFGKALTSAATSYVGNEVFNQFNAPDTSSIFAEGANNSIISPEIAQAAGNNVAELGSNQVGALPTAEDLPNVDGSSPDAPIEDRSTNPLNANKLLKAAGQGALKGVTQAGLRDIISGKGLKLEDLEKGALSGGVGGGTGNVLAQYGYNPIISGAGAGAAGASTSAALNHGNIGDALLKGGVSGGVGGATSMVLNGKDANGNPIFSPIQKGIIAGGIQGATGALLNKKDPITGALINAAGGAAEGATSGLTGNENANRAISSLAGGAARYEAADLLGKSNVHPTANQFIRPNQLQNQSNFTQQALAAPITAPTLQNSVQNNPSPLSSVDLYGLPQQTKMSSYGVNTGLNPMQDSGLSSTLAAATPYGNPAPKLTFEEVISMHPELQGQIEQYPQLANVDPRILLSLIENGENKKTGYKDGGTVALKNGGALTKAPVFITGATGHYVKGHGDGQSDDIPAMLADGEYVFDADTVASLGNGSSDAGAKLLDHFREALREHKRSAPNDKIPPPAAPLQYMKQAIKRHGVSTMTKG
jgi:hypothetical protein